MNRRILSSILIIGVVAAFATGSTLALFNDTETSEDNTFTTGAIDLGIDVDGGPYDGEVIYGQGDNATVPTFFNYGPEGDSGPDIKPLDRHERTLSFHVNNNDAYVCARVIPTENSENGINEPEGEAGDTTPNQGELAQQSDLHIWTDGVEGQTNAGDNQFDSADGDSSVIGPNRSLPTQPVVWTVADSDENVYPGETGALDASTVYYMGVGYFLPDQENNNLVQTDSYQADIEFYAVQARNNDNFDCQEDFAVEDGEFVLEDPGDV